MGTAESIVFDRVKQMKVQRIDAPPSGIDDADAPTGYDANRDIDCDQEQEQAKVALEGAREVTNEMRRLLSHEGFNLEPSIAGEFAGWDIYRDNYLNDPCSPLFHDINPPNTNWYFKSRVRPGDSRLETFVPAAKLSAIRLIASTDNPTLKEIGKKWYHGVIDRPTDRNSIPFHSSRAYGEAKLTRTLTGETPNCHRFVPGRSWFPEEFQKLDARTLLTVFPDAEAELFMLGIGKTLAGKGDDVSDGGDQLEYRFRGLFHVFESGGGVGKSWLIDEQIPKCLELLGYRTDSIDPRMERFSTQWITSDYARLDDANISNLYKLLTHGLMKSVATNATGIFVEQKGVQGKTVTATATAFIASNCNNIYPLYERMDNAQMSRHVPIRIYSSTELELIHGAEWKKYRLPEYWNRVAAEMDTTVECLMCWFFRACLDKFLAAAGYAVDGKRLVKHSESRLEQTMNELRSQLRVDTNLGHREELVEAMAHMVAIATVVSPYRKRIEPKLGSVQPTASVLLALIEMWCKEKNLPEWASALRLPSLTPQIKTQLRGQLDEFKGIVDTKAPGVAFSAILQRLVSDKALSPYTVKNDDSDLSFYAGIWSKHSTVMPLYLSKYKDIDPTELEPETMERLIKLANTLT